MSIGIQTYCAWLAPLVRGCGACGKFNRSGSFAHHNGKRRSPMKRLSTFLMSAGVLLRGSAGRRSLLVLLPSLLFSVCEVSPAIAGKDVFTRTKPHVNVGAVDGE